jgi:calmodulin-binding transcription activator
LQGAKQSFNHAKEAEETAGLSNADSPACSNSFASQSQVASRSMDAESPISGQISEYEDAETGLAVSLSSFCIICTKYTLNTAQ